MQNNKSILSIKQDVKLLSENIVPLGGEGLKAALDKHGVKSSEVDYFLPHMSSNFFKDKIFQRLIENGTGIPYDKWFVNLSTVGNVGIASYDDFFFDQAKIFIVCKETVCK